MAGLRPLGCVFTQPFKAGVHKLLSSGHLAIQVLMECPSPSNTSLHSQTDCRVGSPKGSSKGRWKGRLRCSRWLAQSRALLLLPDRPQA